MCHDGILPTPHYFQWMPYSKSPFRQHKPRLGPSFRFRDDVMDGEFSKTYPARDFLMGLKDERIHIEEADVLVSLRGGVLVFTQGDRKFELTRKRTFDTSVAGMVTIARDLSRTWGGSHDL